MRTKWWVGLVAIVVVGSSFRAQVSVADNKPAPPPKVKTDRVVNQGEEIADGFGRTPTDARERGLSHAQQMVRELLRKRFTPTEWTPPEDYLDPEYLARVGVVTALGEPELDPRFGEEKLLVARYRVKLTSDYLREIGQAIQQDKVVTRHLILARILIGLIAILLVTAGYLRLEEMTRGYATTLLRGAATVVLMLVGAGLWWTW